MILKEMRIMRGPNMWSKNYNKLIAVKLETGLLPLMEKRDEEKLIQFFREKYNIEPPQEHFDLSIFHYTIGLAAKLQGESFYYGLGASSPGILYGLVEYNIEQAGKVALELASNIVISILQDVDTISFAEARKMVADVSRKFCEGPTTSLIIDAARKRNIPIMSGPGGYTLLGHGKKQKRISAAMSHFTSSIGVNIAGNKEDTKDFLQSAYIPVPKGKLAREEHEIKEIAEKLGFPLVTKPLNGNQGRNITCGINNYESLLAGFRYAKEISKSVLIEKQIKGNDFRILVIGNKFIAASLRLPAFVVGNGTSTINELIEEENNDPRRGNGHENILTKIKMDPATEVCLHKQGLSVDSIPAEGQNIFLKTTANLSTGGTAEDVTDFVHPRNKKIAEKVAQLIGLDICGIDIMSPDLSVPLDQNGGAVIEVNAAPGLRMHQYPNKGLSRNVGAPIVDLMFEPGDEGRIPIIAITGTNGKTTTTRLMAHVASYVGNTVGFTTTDGIYIAGEQILKGDCSGPQSARTVLQDPTVDFAVFECARGGIIRSGLAFDRCDIGIVTNVAADHLGLKDIYTVEDLANVKSVVPKAVKKDGWAILNAGNEHALAMKENLQCKVALFCLDDNNEHLKDHLSSGGIAAFTDGNKHIYIFDGKAKLSIGPATDLPITRNGKAGFMIENVLPVVLAAYLSGIKEEHIYLALKSFIPTAEQTPGRINEFKINGVNVIVDYAHNPHGLRALSNYLKNIPERKLGIITGTGDRRDDDIIEFGQIAAETYDEIIIRFDRDTRGRTKESIVELLVKGMHQIKPALNYKVIPDTSEAIKYAIANAQKGSYVVVCADDAIYTVGLTKNIALEYQLENIDPANVM